MLQCANPPAAFGGNYQWLTQKTTDAELFTRHHARSQSFASSRRGCTSRRSAGMGLHTKQERDMGQPSGTIYTDRQLSMEH
jgi:hypothetical protein